jgi:uncharacterized SAM-binding protein YcdF (DUF218 family)
MDSAKKRVSTSGFMRGQMAGRARLRLRRAAFWLGGVALFLVTVALTAYYCSPQILCVDSGAVKAGALVVLGGDSVHRPVRAAELFRSNAAPVVVVSGGPGGCEDIEAMLKARGVPAGAIVVEDRSRNTMENAEFSVAILRRGGLTNAIIVTSWYHSRRALNCFRHAAPEMQFYSRPSYDGLVRAEWSRNGMGTNIRAEYMKLMGYWVRYGVCPL